MMKDKSPVNIVVPVYNVADLLSRCVDSLLAQTYEDVRIVLVDDGSTDDCPAICDRYAEQDPRITSLHRTNGGLSAARNTGIDHVFSIEEPSRGRYIAFVDSDDWVEPGYVESMLETLEAYDADAAQCGHFVSYAPDNEDDKDPAHTRATLDRAQAVESLCRNGLWDVTAWNKLYRLDLFRQIRYPEGLLYEDTATTYLITQECDRVAVDMTSQYHYTQRYTSIANGTTWKDSKLDLVLAGDRMAAWVCEHYPDLKTAAAEKRAYVRLSTLSQMVNTSHQDKDLARRLRREVLSVAPTVLRDRRASKRDKLGILALLPGFWCYRAIWSRYYEAKRNRTVAGPAGAPDTTTIMTTAAVITLHQVDNYGTQLQAYATQEKLKQYFDNVVLIDYRRPDTYGKGLVNSFAKSNPVKALAFLPTYLLWKKVFDGFRSKYLNLTEKTYLSESDFKNFNDFADVYVSGSDQVWNSGWNKGVIPCFYLDFAPDGKPKYAYASSFGRNHLDENEVNQSKKYIDRFDMISVREQSGVDILNNQYGYHNAVQIVDPTLAMPASFWRSIATKPRVKGDYILIYNLNRSKEFDGYADELSRRTGLPIYRFCTRVDQVFRNGKSLVVPEILDFVSLVDNAKYVLTDSFHATAFSMNMGTEPICIYPGQYSGRLSEFLKLVDSEQRHVDGYDDFDVINRHVDFAKVERILGAERTRVDEYLTNMQQAVLANKQ